MAEVSLWREKISLKRFGDGDLDFLEALYASVREPELAMTNFSQEEKLSFLKSQFAAQHNHYCSGYNTEHFYIIYAAGERAGRFFVDYWDEEIRIVDIALMPSFRQLGLGSYLLKDLFSKAEKLKQPVSIHVERHNPARRLYERLGFEIKGAHDEIYLLMEWNPKEVLEV
ncbi:GNAT family N-acetyltransferase [Aliikangiella coralliicola]|uniref:GNAT family N-acetyltransferase n=1 Tax=Aliikangiella coralliicola TaxID=2592383 RepID=A0A545U7F7_9GAMM|nr:GNAT family N-acetyltransferase [Aliikangiella coralliicola]TQV85343.1 GNAT family N-acetyltransferase [Aliikangiella coralliicola]